MSDADMDEREVEWVRRREAEEAAEQARLAAQRSRTDLSPLSPAPGTWIIESRWKQIDKYGPHTLRHSREGREKATLEGRSLACCAGIVAVRVIAPDGTVCESYDREGNFWLCHDEATQ